jgi:hypothetical protein
MVCGIPAPKIPDCGTGKSSENAKMKAFPVWKASFRASEKDKCGVLRYLFVNMPKCKLLNQRKLLVEQRVGRAFHR